MDGWIAFWDLAKNPAVAIAGGFGDFS